MRKLVGQAWAAIAFEAGDTISDATRKGAA